MIRNRTNQNRTNQRTGRMAEKLTEIALRQRGYLLVEKVEAPRTKTGVYLRTCSGDFRAIQPGGLSVLVECKYRDRPLRKTDFRHHQWASMKEHHGAGGITLVAHVTRYGCSLIRWHLLFPLEAM